MWLHYRASLELVGLELVASGNLFVRGGAAPECVSFSCIDDVVDAIHIFDSNKLLLEIIVEEIVVARICEDLLGLELAQNELLHL